MGYYKFFCAPKGLFWVTTFLYKEGRIRQVTTNTWKNHLSTQLCWLRTFSGSWHQLAVGKQLEHNHFIKKHFDKLRKNHERSSYTRKLQASWTSFIKWTHKYIIQTLTHILYTWCIPPASYVDRNQEDASTSVWAYTFHKGNTFGRNHRLLSSTSDLYLKIIKFIHSDWFFTARWTILTADQSYQHKHTNIHRTTKQHTE